MSNQSTESKPTWWEKLFKKETEKKKIDIDTDIDAIREFCDDAKRDLKELEELLKNFENLHKESHITRHTASHMNTKTRIALFEDILERYSSFEDDVEINKERLKLIAKHLLDDASKAGHKEEVQLKKQDPLWKFEW